MSGRSGDSAKRSLSTAAGGTQDNDCLTFGNTNLAATTNATYGLGTATVTTDWVDERTPSFKIGYDEANQRLTFDGVNKDLEVKVQALDLILLLHIVKS